MKKLIFAIVIFSFLSIGSAFSQSGWSSGRYYANCGEVWTNCGNPYPKYWGYDAFGRPIYRGMHKVCKTTVWHQEWREGYIWYWNNYTRSWYSQWESGYFWYYTWNTYEVFVRW